MNKITQAALEWAADGVPVFPCNSNKRPMTENGFYDATTDPDQVKQLFDLAGNNALIGGRMGAASGLVACDFDIYKAGEAGEAAQKYMADLLAEGLLPDTQRHKTMNGGLHLIYEATEFPNCKPCPGVEIKGEGGYIILPPSRGYSIEADIGFRRAPSALIEALLKARTSHTGKTVDQHEEAIVAAKDFHDSITSLAAKLFRRGYSASEIYKRIRNALNASVASNPHHPRHERWLSLVQDAGGEISRILNSGKSKYDQQAKTQKARDQVDDEQIERIRKAASDAGFAPSPSNYDSTQNQHENSVTYDYGNEWPFENDGYFAHEQLEVADQDFNIYPIYASNESVVIAADPKSGKTAISLKLAMYLASGRSLGPFKVTEPKAVLYYALEGTRAIKLRIEAEKRKQAEEGNAFPAEFPLFVVERPTNFIKAQDANVSKVIAANEFFKQQRGVNLGLIVIDTLTKAMPGSDQNSVDDTSALFDFTTQLRAHGITATVVFVHHTGKDGRTRGSSNIEAEVDVVLKMRKQEDSSTMMYVHMARSIDDNSMYRFELNSYDLGSNKQGITQTAPIVTLTEGSIAADVSDKDAIRAQKIVPYLSAMINTGAGSYTVEDLYKIFKEAKLVVKRQRKQHVVDMLDLIFDRELAVTFKGHVISAKKDNDDYVSINVAEPGAV